MIRPFVFALAVLLAPVWAQTAAVGAEAKSEGTLAERLAVIERQASVGGDLAKLEAKLLAMIPDSRSQQEQGEIYASAAAVYAARSPIAQPYKLKSYATKALGYPLDVKHKTLMYVDLANAQVAIYELAEPQGYLKHRGDVAEPCLLGLKLLLDTKVPTKVVEGFGVDKYDFSGPPNDPELLRMEKRHAEQMAARAAADAMNELVRWRGWFTAELVGMYSLGTDGTAELRALATRILKDDALVADLCARAQADRVKWDHTAPAP